VNCVFRWFQEFFEVIFTYFVQIIYAKPAYLISMRCVECDNSYYWSEEQKARISSEREKLKKRMAELKKQWDAFEDNKRQLRESREQNNDPELDPDFPRMVERGLAKIAGKQDVLKSRLEELTKRLQVLDAEERQLNALLSHEKYPEWVDLKERRDKAVEEVARLDAEMKRLLESMTLETSSQ
jgi:DNA repair exonuclease SbcCD ATPase subunit